MRIAGLAIVKNEADIIEAFVRHNLRFVDRLIVIDNVSADSTALILRNLVEEGLPLTVESDARPNHPQVDALNDRLHALKSDAPDFLVLLDADEFISCADRTAFEAALQTLPDGVCGLLEWIYYVPIADDDAREVNPVRRIRHCRRPARPRHKVVVPQSILCGRDFRLKPGNHRCLASAPPDIEHRNINAAAIAHFPVRSAEQLAGKVIIGEWALAARNNRRPAEGFHWRHLHARVMGGESLALQDLQDIAAYYSMSKPDGVYELQERPLPVLPGTDLKYVDLIDSDCVANALDYADQYFGNLASTALSNNDVSIGKTRHGLMAYHEGDTVIGRSVKLYGEWAAAEIGFLKEFVRPGDWVVDVGANIGTHTIPLSEFVGPAGKVFAFEPQRITYQLLCANAALNGRYNIYAHNIGLGNREATASIPICTRGNIGKLGAAGWGQGEPVKIVPLDAWSFPELRLIKIDVEGMEREVIEGGARTIDRCKPVLFVENNTRQTSEALIQAIFNLGYRCWWFFDPYYNPGNYYGNAENIFAKVGRPEINMVCVHREQNLELRGLVPVAGARQDWEEAWRSALGAAHGEPLR